MSGLPLVTSTGGPGGLRDVDDTREPSNAGRGYCSRTYLPSVTGLSAVASSQRRSVPGSLPARGTDSLSWWWPVAPVPAPCDARSRGGASLAWPGPVLRAPRAAWRGAAGAPQAPGRGAAETPTTGEGRGRVAVVVPHVDATWVVSWCARDARWSAACSSPERRPGIRGWPALAGEPCKEGTGLSDFLQAPHLRTTDPHAGIARDPRGRTWHERCGQAVRRSSRHISCCVTSPSREGHGRCVPDDR